MNRDLYSMSIAAMKACMTALHRDKRPATDIQHFRMHLAQHHNVAVLGCTLARAALTDVANLAAVLHH